MDAPERDHSGVRGDWRNLLDRVVFRDGLYLITRRDHDRHGSKHFAWRGRTLVGSDTGYRGYKDARNKLDDQRAEDENDGEPYTCPLCGTDLPGQDFGVCIDCSGRGDC